MSAGGRTDEETDVDDVDPSDVAPEPAPRSSARGRTAVLIVTPIAVVLVVLIAILATRAPASDREVDSPLLGQPAPRIEGTTLEGKPFDSATYDGRWLLVNFFATWCGPCVKEHPELVAFQQGQSEQGAANVVSVVFSDERDAVERFFARNGGDWPVVLADDSVVAQWGVSGVPESYLIDPGGTVRAKLVGGVTAAGLDGLIAQASGAPTTAAPR